MSAHAHDLAAEQHEDHGHHHKETFVTKYIFSQDHKMISKQYLITGLFMGIIGIGMSLIFRMQLAWPDKQFPIYEVLLGKNVQFPLLHQQISFEDLTAYQLL